MRKRLPRLSACLGLCLGLGVGVDLGVGLGLRVRGRGRLTLRLRLRGRGGLRAARLSACASPSSVSSPPHLRIKSAWVTARGSGGLGSYGWG